MGLSYKKTKHLPGKMPSKEIQETCIEEITELVKEAKESNGKSIVLSADPTHPTHNSVPGHLWQEKGKDKTQTVCANTGRKRVTVMGAIDLVSHEITPFVTESNADKESLKVYLLEIKKAYPEADKITLIIDNAPYQKSSEVQGYAKELGITLFYLPSYAPNLSLIERVWKFFKKVVLRNSYYASFELFFEAVCDFFRDWDQYKEQIKSLVTLNFEIL